MLFTQCPETFFLEQTDTQIETDRKTDRNIPKLSFNNYCKKIHMNIKHDLYWHLVRVILPTH